MFVRKKLLREKTYYYLVETKREGKHVKQTSLKYLGKQRPSREYVDGIIEEIMHSRRGGKSDDSGNSHFK